MGHRIIRFRTLGGLDLRGTDGAEVRSVLAQPKRLGFLLYLAAATPRGFHRKDTLKAMFWPESDDEHSRRALNRTVYVLRHELGRDLLVSRGDEDLALADVLLWCDVTAFEQAVEQGKPEEALELYHGDFAPGFFVDCLVDFERWVESERRRLRDRALETALGLAERAEASGELSLASHWAHRATTLAPHDEGAIRRCIIVLDRAGDRAGALRAYEEFAARLRGDFEVEPSPETRALRDAVHARREPAPVVGPGGTTPQVTGSTPTLAPVAGVKARTHSLVPALTAPEAARQVAPLRPLLAAVLVVTVAVGAWRGLAGARGKVPGAASVIAVAPFAPSMPDTTLERLGRDLVVTLSANLDGVGDIRTADASAILLQPRDPGQVYTREEAGRLARRLGAGSVVQGSLIRVGQAVRAEVALVTSDSLRVLARASVTAPIVALDVLTDSLTWVILRQIWRTRAPPTPSLAAVTTRSVQALREFLDGEQAIGRDFLAAAASYGRAIKRDSTFWLAHFRYYYARQYSGGSSDFQGADTAMWREVVTYVVEHRDALPERERLHIESDPRAIEWLQHKGFASAFLAHDTAIGALIAQYPDYWWGWWDYADHRVHGQVPDYGGAAAARAALEQTVALNPAFSGAWNHLLIMSLGRDTAVTTRAIRALTALGEFSEDTVGLEPNAPWLPGGPRLADALPYVRLLDGAQRAGGRPDTALADSVARILAGFSLPNHHHSFAVHSVWFGLPHVTTEVSRRVLRIGVSSDAAQHLLRGIALAWAARGAWDSALVAMDRVGGGVSQSEVALEAYRLAVVGASLGAVEPEAAQARRATLAGAIAGLEVARRAEVLWLDGLLAAARNDGAALSRARADLGRMQDTAAMLLQGTLSALELAAAGAQDRAGHDLAAHQLSPAFGSLRGLFPYLPSVNRLLASRWLIESGDTAQAMRLLVWHEAELTGGGSRAVQQVDGVLSGIADLELGRVYAARRQDDLARYYYTQFLQRYDAPVPALRGQVREARAELTRLPGQPQSRD